MKTPLLDHQIAGTLAESLVSVADDIRGLYTDFGARPYRVFLVWIGWSRDVDGDGIVSSSPVVFDEDQEDLLSVAETDLEVGTGRPYLLREIELLPTPLVSPAGTRRDADVYGATERGAILASQISPSYSEDLLLGLLGEYRDPSDPSRLAEGVTFFWEVRENRPKCFSPEGRELESEATQEKSAVRRRYQPVDVPIRDMLRLEWSLALTRASGSRSREGEV